MSGADETCPSYLPTADRGQGRRPSSWYERPHCDTHGVPITGTASHPPEERSIPLRSSKVDFFSKLVNKSSRPNMETLFWPFSFPSASQVSLKDHLSFCWCEWLRYLVDRGNVRYVGACNHGLVKPQKYVIMASTFLTCAYKWTDRSFKRKTKTKIMLYYKI